MKTYALSRSDGGVTITRASDSADILKVISKWEALTGAVTAGGPLKGVTIVAHREIAEAAIPPDRTFRGALKPDLTHDMSKCREIHKNKLRELRAPKFAALDIEHLRADEAANTTLKQQIAAKKQALRDVTADPRIAAARTPEELKAVIPVVLT